MSDEQAPRGRRRARVLTRTRVEEAALRYLGQRDASRAQLRASMVRRVERSLAAHPEQDREELIGWVDEVIAKCERLGYVDDERFAKLKTRALHQRGASSRKIRADLRQKWVDVEIVEREGQRAAGHELSAALRLLRRKRRGPWAREDVGALSRDEARRVQQRTLGTLARAGFGYELSRRAMEMPYEEAEERLAQDHFDEA